LPSADVVPHPREVGGDVRCEIDLVHDQQVVGSLKQAPRERHVDRATCPHRPKPPHEPPLCGQEDDEHGQDGDGDTGRRARQIRDVAVGQERDSGVMRRSVGFCTITMASSRSL